MDQVYGLWNLNHCNQNLRTKVHMHDPTKFLNIYFSKKKAQHNFCSFRFKVSIHKEFHQHTPPSIYFILSSILLFNITLTLTFNKQHKFVCRSLKYTFAGRSSICFWCICTNSYINTLSKAIIALLNGYYSFHWLRVPTCLLP